jgi:hypothetical protein
VNDIRNEEHETDVRKNFHMREMIKGEKEDCMNERER